MDYHREQFQQASLEVLFDIPRLQAEGTSSFSMRELKVAISLPVRHDPLQRKLLKYTPSSSASTEILLGLPTSSLLSINKFDSPSGQTSF